MKKAVIKPEKNKRTRLPCRGCTRQCQNYDKCHGKPWRLVNP